MYVYGNYMKAVGTTVKRDLKTFGLIGTHYLINKQHYNTARPRVQLQTATRYIVYDTLIYFQMTL